MSLGTKVLLLTLASTLGLAGLVIWVVSAAVKKHEVNRAQETIHAAVSHYFERVDLQRQRVGSTVRLLLEDPQQRAWMETASRPSDSDDRTRARAQLHDEILGKLLQTELTDADGISPAFAVLVDARGKVAVASSPRSGLESALAGVQWLRAPLTSDSRIDRQVFVNNNLYVAFGVLLRSDFEQSDQQPPSPTHACFVGFDMDNAMLRRLLGRIDRENAHASADSIPALSSWIVINGKVVACVGEETSTDAAAIAERGTAIESHTPPTSNRVERAKLDFDTGGERLLGESFAITPAPNIRGTFAVVSSLDRALAPLHRIQRNIALVTIIVILGAVVASRIMSIFITRPVRQLVEGTVRISRGEFDKPIQARRRDELGDLARSFNEMAAGLAQRDLIKDALGKFVDPSVAEAVLRDPDALKGERRVQTVLFSDLVNFTPLSERLAPEDQVRLLNAHLGDAADIVHGSKGIVDKFIGDCVMAFWGPPASEDYAVRACRAALAMVASVSRHAESCQLLRVDPLRLRVGVATGEVVVGIIGSSSKYDFTVMGDTVNLGSRLEGLNKAYGTSILVCNRTAAEAGDAFVFREIDSVRVVGRTGTTKIFELLGERDAVDQPTRDRAARYAEALSKYRARQWNEARAIFESLNGDAVGRVMALRCEKLAASGVEENWDGVWKADSK